MSFCRRKNSFRSASVSSRGKSLSHADDRTTSIIDTFQAFQQPSAPIEPVITALTGITDDAGDDHLSNKPPQAHSLLIGGARVSLRSSFARQCPPCRRKRASERSAPRWSREFEDLIVLADGRTLVTLRDGDLHHQTAKAEQDLEIWQIAVEHLIRAAETGGGWLMLARIGVLKALHRGVVREFNPDRQDTHWGKRKLKRDE